MAFNSQAGSSSHFFPQNPFPSYAASSSSSGHERSSSPSPSQQFDILEWYPHFQSCHRYFLDHAQHTSGVQALVAFVNIQLPYQKMPSVMSSTNHSPPAAPNERGAHLRQAPFAVGGQNNNNVHAQGVSLIPYIRRLIATGHDSPGVLHGFFGDDWRKGIGSLHEIERRNYLFAAKSVSWAKVKAIYDMSPQESVPFLSPLKTATEKEIHAADLMWSEWLLMQDWMLGPRDPRAAEVMDHQHHGETRVKRENED